MTLCIKFIRLILPSNPVMVENHRRRRIRAKLRRMSKGIIAVKNRKRLRIVDRPGRIYTVTIHVN